MATISRAIRERNQILARMDIPGAQSFIRLHGGEVPTAQIDWNIVISLAILEVTNLSEELKQRAAKYLDISKTPRLDQLDSESPYLWPALDLIFPRDEFEAFVTQHGGAQA